MLSRWGGAVLSVGCVFFLLGACGGPRPSQGAGSTVPVTAGQGGQGGQGGQAAREATTGSDASATFTGDAGLGATDQRNDAGFVTPAGGSSRQVSQLFAEGSAAFSRGDFPTAARAFEQAYRLQPTAEMAFNLARVYDRMGEVEGAIRHYEIVLRSQPDPEQRTFIEGRIAALRAYEQRRREGIAQAPASAAELNQEGLQWFQRGVRFFSRRQYRQALMAFEQAALHLQTPELYFNLGMTHERLGNIDQAIEFLREYLNTRRGTPEEEEIQRHIERLEQRR